MATLGLTATPQPTSTPPGVRLDVTASGTPTVTSVTVMRTDTGGRAYPVRTSDGGPLPLSGGVATIFDYEIPYGQTATYSVAATGVTTANATALLDVSAIWLVHVGVPAVSVPLFVSEFGELVRPSNQGVFDIIGRKDPVVVSGGARGSAAGTLSLRTKTDSERVALDQLLDDATGLFLNVPAGLRWGVESCYIAVGDVTAERTVEWAEHPYREWRLPYRVVGRPAGGSQASRTYATVAGEYATYAAIAATGKTYAELANPIT